MVSESYDDIKRFPHQIYASCLTFCPLDSLLFKQYSQLSTVQVLSGERKPWRPLLHTFKNPDRYTDNLTFSPDGTILASSSSDTGKIHLWDLKTKESCVLVYPKSRRHRAVTFSPDGKYIATDGHVYRVTTGEEVLMPGICSAFSPDGLYIALGYADGIIKLYDMQAPNLSLFGNPFGHGSRVTTLVFSSDNKFLVSASWDRTIRVWNRSSREMMKQIRCREPSGLVNFSANGTYVTAHYESFVLNKGFEKYVWVADFQTGKEKSIKMLDDRVSSYLLNLSMTTPIFSPSGDYIAFWNKGALYLVRWVAATQLSGTRLSQKFGSAITSFSFTPDEQSLLIGDRKGLIRSWRIPKRGGSTHRFDFECKAHSGMVKAITFSPNGNYFASTSNDGSVCIWDSTSVDLHETDLTHTSDLCIHTVTFAPDGQTVAIIFGNTLSKIDATTGRSIFHKKHVMPYSYTPRSFIFSADGKYLTSDMIQELFFWDKGDTSRKWGKSITAHAFSPDTTHYVLLLSTGHLWIHDLRNGETQQVLRENCFPNFHGMRFSRDSRHIVSFGVGGICVFDVEKGVQMELIRGSVDKCAFSPCGQHIAIAHGSGVDVWEFLAKEPNRKVHSQDGGYQSIEFSPDGKQLLAVRRTEEVYLFHPDTLEILYTTIISKEHVYYAMREFRRTGRLLNHPLFQLSEYENFPSHLDKDGWVITVSSKRLCLLPVANRGNRYDMNGNRIVVVSPEGKVTFIQFGPNPIYIPIAPDEYGLLHEFE